MLLGIFTGAKVIKISGKCVTFAQVFIQVNLFDDELFVASGRTQPRRGGARRRGAAAPAAAGAGGRADGPQCRPLPSRTVRGLRPDLHGAGRGAQDVADRRGGLPRADPPRRRPHDLPAGGRRGHRDRRHGLRGIGLHARRSVRVRLDDAAGVCRCERRRQERRQSGRVQEHGGRFRPAAIRRLRHVALRDASPAGDSRRTGRGGQGGDHRRRTALRADRAGGTRRPVRRSGGHG